ncbi:MAG: Two component regulator three Y domain-containing protein, partial [Leeuwenhoekiella sp.]
MKSCILNLILFFFFSSSILAQELIPPILNYNNKEYNAASQNWGLSSDYTSFLYAANNEGLLRYDGQRWTKFQLPNKTIIRSVFCHNGRIYTGSYEEFGYWENDGFGSLKYTSLTHLIKDTFDNEEFWGISALDDGVVFRSFGRLYIYQNNSIIAYKPDFFITALLSHNGEIILGSNAGGLYKFENKTFISISNNKIENGDAINSISAFNNKLLIGTRLHGIFTLRNEKLEPWGTQNLADFLVKNELNKVKIFDNNHVVFGTIKGGVLTTDASGKILNNYHRGNGLQNNTVLALDVQNKVLWVGLDNGIDAIKLEDPFTYYSDRSGELGAVYDIAFFENAFYLGTNTGIHVIKNGKQQFVEGSQGQVWNFTQIGDKLFANHNRGIFEIKDAKLFPVSEITGSYRLDKVPKNPDFYINSTYNGLSLYSTKNTQNLSFIKSIGKINTPFDKIIFQDDNTAWTTHPYKGFFQLTFNTDDLSVKDIKDFDSDSIFKAYKTSIHKIENQISFYNADTWYKYNAINDAIEPFHELKNYSGYGLISDDDNFYWFKNRKGNGLIYTNFTTDSLFIYEPLLENRLIKGYDKVVKLNDSVHLITLYEGYAAVNLAQLKRNASIKKFPAPVFNGFNDNDKIFALSEKEFKIDYKDASQITIKISAPSVPNPRFYYKLNNKEAYLNNGFLRFQNLPSQDYKLQIWSIANGTLSEKPLVINFAIAPPWYYSNLMLAVYGLIFILVIILVYIINKRKLDSHRYDVEQRLIKEQERNIQIAE